MGIVMYLDDGLLSCENYQDTEREVRIIRNDLLNAGFIINEQKSHWAPCQKVTWLGFTLDTKNNIFSVPQEKLARLKQKLVKNLAYASHCSAREIAKTVGTIGSMHHAFGPIVHLMTKECTRWIDDRLHWNNLEILPQSVIRELQFWLRNLNVVVQMPLVPDNARKVLIIFSDASATGCGALVVGRPDLNMVHHWQFQERARSSTWREIKAITIFIELHKHLFKNNALKWYTDNLGVTSVIVKGSMKPDLHLCSLEIFEVCLQNDIMLSVDWVPRTNNEPADYLSKIQDQDDWGIDHRIFNQLNESHGPIVLDVFASNLTAKTQKFYSKYWCENSAGVDAFAYEWKEGTCWVVPPFYLVNKAIRHMKHCHAIGILIVPRWQSAVFWPALHDGTNWKQGISLIKEFIKPTNFFTACV